MHSDMVWLTYAEAEGWRFLSLCRTAGGVSFRGEVGVFLADEVLMK